MDINLEKKLEEAARKAIKKLLSENKEHFYYCSLITDGEGHCPVISAWSQEALERILEEEAEPDEDMETVRLEYKWSYADSPYYAYGEEFFEEIKELFDDGMEDLDDEQAEEEVNLRIEAMERVMAALDQEGLFGIGDDRMKIVINAEIMPPDYGNTERAIRLNPKEALKEWLEEIAEFE
ncbi:DUF4303 domain-containing protein [bacterium D16-51]|nr:DUF4303 domain-containing protein [bacterium D16-59]RKI61682.1 DUF4303 domain-containing protein [bacterium D16-51]